MISNSSALNAKQKHKITSSGWRKYFASFTKVQSKSKTNREQMGTNNASVTKACSQFHQR
jgi:hypothetical protein